MHTTIDEDVTLKILLEEKKELRHEVAEVGTSLAGMGKLFITAFGSSVAVLFSKDAINNPGLVQGLTYALSQVEFVICFITLFFITNLAVHGGYLKAVEEEINKRAGSDVIMWDSRIIPNFIQGHSGIFWWQSVIALVTCVVLYAYLLFRAADLINNMVMGIVIAIEFGATVITFFLTAKEYDNAYNHAKEKYNQQS